MLMQWRKKPNGNLPIGNRLTAHQPPSVPEFIGPVRASAYVRLLSNIGKILDRMLQNQFTAHTRLTI